MSLKTSYRFIAPFYDAFIAGATHGARQRSLARLPQQGAQRVLLCGAGTGLDFPHLPPCHTYTALDVTQAMLRRAAQKSRGLQVEWVLGDAMALPFAARSFDCVVLHLILAVVPQPELCLAEVARVLKPGGRVLLLDKFLRRGSRAWLRRSLSPVVGQLATRLDVVFEDILEAVPELRVVSDEPALARGWFRLIELQREGRHA